MDNWNAKTYSQFLDLRTQPAKDLLARIPANFKPNLVYDLGCGPGNSTALLKERFNNAKVIGVDSSYDMLQEAQKKYPEIAFVKEDIANFAPDQKIDLLFANASLQWLPSHQTLLPRLLQLLRRGGVFAFQLPNNFHAPSHQVAIDILKHHKKLEALLKKLIFSELKHPFYDLRSYYDLLTKANASLLQLWETEYFQEMTDYHEIFTWVKGTGLNPIITSMDQDELTRFTELYIKNIAKKYPLQQNHKILMPYRRIFMVGFFE